MSPMTALMHDRPPSSIEEECELMDLDLCAYVLEWLARVPSWRDTYFALDHYAHYAFLKRQLQVLSFLRGPRRWVLKCPQHLEQLGPAPRHLPRRHHRLHPPRSGGRPAVGHHHARLRRPQPAGGGRCRRARRLLGRPDRAAAARRGARRRPDPGRPADRRRVRRVHARRRGHGVAHPRAWPDSRSATTPRGQLEAYVAGNPRGRDGRIVYDLRGDFHLDPAELYERYAFYFDAFPQITPEVH